MTRPPHHFTVSGFCAPHLNRIAVHVPRTPKTPPKSATPSDAMPAGAAAGADDKERRGRFTINDIARLSGVSKKTVSRVINKSPYVKEDTRRRVEEIIAEHDYEPDPQARGLAFRRSFLVGMIYDNPNPQYVVNMQQGVLDALSGTGLELVIRPCNRSDPGLLDGIRTFVELQKLAGVVLPPSVSEDKSLISILRKLDCPYVRIASVPLDVARATVITHDRLGGEAAAVLLAELGHRRIAHISGPPTFRSSFERRAGFIDGLAGFGLALDPELWVEGAYTYESGYECGLALLGRRDRPSAIFTGNDEMATGVYRAAQELGIPIPGALSVVGFDDAPVASRVWPPLTSVRLPIREMGRRAAERLLLLQRDEADDAEAIEFQPLLVRRGSTGPAA